MSSEDGDMTWVGVDQTVVDAEELDRMWAIVSAAQAWGAADAELRAAGEAWDATPFDSDEEAAADVRCFDARNAVRAARIALRAALADPEEQLPDGQRILAEALPRPATASEADTTTLEEANKDAGCESCARIVEPSGSRRYRSTYATGKVTSVSEAETSGSERRRRALLTGEDNRDRLAVDTRLCRPCLEQVKRTVSPGAQLTLGEALHAQRR